MIMTRKNKAILHLPRRGLPYFDVSSGHSKWYVSNLKTITGRSKGVKLTDGQISVAWLCSKNQIEGCLRKASSFSALDTQLHDAGFHDHR
jgi:hypothetical protein